MSKFNFTNNRLKKIYPGEKDSEYFDTDQKGLLLRVTPTGNKIFRFLGWSKRKRKMIKIVLGHYPDLSINDAREIAADHLMDLTKGVDVIERRKKEREEQTLDEVFEIWLEEHAKPNLKRWDQEKKRYELYIQPHFGNKQLSEITPDLIHRWKLKLSKQLKKRQERNEDGKIVGPPKLLSRGMIHRAQIVLSSIFGKSARQLQNPCSAVDKYQPQTRTVFLGSDHLSKFFNTLDHIETPEWLKEYLLISLFTGARQSNVLGMQWSHIDLSLKLWMIPREEMKNKDPMIIPLLDPLIEILEKRKKTTSSIFVFPSVKSKTGHIVNIRKPWKALLKRADLPTDYRLHDIRRTMGSWQAITGTSTKIIGASLGHKSEQATAHYAHLTTEPVRAAMQKAVDAMEAQRGLEKVVEIRKTKRGTE